MPHPHCYSQIFDWLSRAIRKQTIKVSVPTLEQRIGADAALDSLEPLCRIHIAADANGSWTLLARIGARRKNSKMDNWCQPIESSSSININFDRNYSNELRTKFSIRNRPFQLLHSIIHSDILNCDNHRSTFNFPNLMIN